MNILFYYSNTISPKHGGIAQVTQSLGEEFVSEGHNVYFLSALNTVSSDNVKQYYLPVQLIKSKKNEEYFQSFLKTYKIDVIINQNGTSPKSNEAIIWGEKANIPVITVLHNSLFGIYGIHQKKLLRFHPVIYRLKAEKVIDRFIRYYFRCKYGKYFKEQVIKCAQIVVLSPKFLPEIRYFSGMNAKNVTSISNPLTIHPKEFNKDIKQKEILFVGRISYEKRVDILLKIWQIVYQKFPNWKLTIVGDGPLKKKMELYASKLQLQRISFEGYKYPVPYYERASIFCMTSAFEGFGLVLTEAMACGTVPIAFNSYANVSEIIDNNINGFLISPFSELEYANQLSALMLNENKREEMAILAIQKSQMFKIEKISRQWIQLICNLKRESYNGK